MNEPQASLLAQILHELQALHDAVRAIAATQGVQLEPFTRMSVKAPETNQCEIEKS